MSAEACDAVVVGAGPNGLVAANILAEAGWDVMICEAADEPGGAVRSAEVTAPGFSTDLGSAFYPLGAASPVLRELDLGRYGLRWRHAPAVLAHLFPDNRCALLSRDLDRTVDSVEQFHPDDGPAWRAMYREWSRVSDALLSAVLGPFPPVRSSARLARRLGVAEGLRFVRMLMQPAHRLVLEHFRGDGARLLLTGNALHADLGPDEAGSGVFGWLLSMTAQELGFPVPEGGAGMITRALTQRLAEFGGRVDTWRPVAQVLIRDGRAIGVRDEAGDTIRARRAVLADVAAPLLYRDLVGLSELPRRMVADLERFEWDDATIKVNWALRAPIPWSAPEARQAGTVHLSADLKGLRAFSWRLASGEVPSDPYLILGQMTTSDPSRSPAGTESAWAYTHVPRDVRWTPPLLSTVVERIEAVIERHAPGFGQLIMARHVQGPGDLQEMDGSLNQGAINAGTSALYQQMVFRPIPGLARADTPIDRLFLAGASAHPGGAVHGAPGANAARAALAANGRAGPLYRAAMRSAHRSLYPPLATDT
jgi:phytoene dehydrogenase-like protein